MNTHTAREKALSYVLRVQEKDGGWKSATAADTAGMLQPAVHTTTFAATLILNAIAALPDSLLKQSIVRRGVAYLRTEASTAWTYNYWKRGSSDAKTTVYPDDTDDTFCALAALSQLAPTVVDGTVLAKSVALLTAQEAAVGGPYRTWIIDPKQKRWHNIDIGVNSNIAYFLSLHGIELPRLTAYVEHEIEREVYASEFYHNPYLVIYFISRFYTGKNKETLISFLLKKRTKGGTWGTVLDTALALTTLIRLGYTGSVIKSAARFLEKNQQKDGSWSAAPLYIERVEHKKIFYSGSQALTTALCAEALWFFETQTTIPPTAENGNKQKKEKENIFVAQIVQAVLDDFRVFSKKECSVVQSLVSTLLAGDPKHEITLLPLHFYSLLKKPPRISNAELHLLCAANVHGWLAYRIYDDVLDHEGVPGTIALANISLRRLTTIYHALLGKEQMIFHTIMNALDHANWWEYRHCRCNLETPIENSILPRYGTHQVLAQKSLGHALGPLTLLIRAGFKPNSSECTALTNFFTHYIIARQLNDDAHDWKSDLERGYINSASAPLIAEWQKEYPKECTETISELLPRLELLFWNSTIVTVSKHIFQHVRLARKALAQLSCLASTTPLEALLTPLEASAQRALREQKRALEFVTAYK